MIRLLLGDSNIPMPTPITPRYSTTSKVLEFAVIVLNRKSDSPIKPNPTVVGMREPILSESRPASGATTSMAMGIVI